MTAESTNQQYRENRWGARIVLMDEIVTRQYYDETGQIKYHQILLPKHLLRDLVQAFRGTAGTHSGISKMLQEIR